MNEAQQIAREELILAAKIVVINLCHTRRKKTRIERRLINAVVQVCQLDRTEPLVEVHAK